MIRGGKTLLAFLIAWRTFGAMAQDGVTPNAGARDLAPQDLGTGEMGNREGGTREVDAATGAAPIRIGPFSFYAGHGSHEDWVSIGQDLTVKEGEEAHEVVVIAGDTRIEGEVRGSVVSVLGNVHLAPGATIRGELVVVGGSLEMSPGAAIRGPRMVLPGLGWTERLREWVRDGLLFGRPFPARATWAWALAGGFLLLYLMMAALLPGPTRACVQALERRPVRSFFAGLGTLVLLGPVILLLVVSVVGALVIPFLLFALLTAFLFGKVAVYQYAGAQFAAQARVGFLQSPFMALVLGAALFFVLYLIPILGFVAWGVVITMGFGAVVVALVGSVTPQPAPGVPLNIPSDVTPVVGSTEPAVSPPAMSLLPPELTTAPRAGFWLRLLGTALDAVLIGTVLALLRTQQFIPAVWIVYHLVMWTWKGATMGGLVVGIKIVRTDGRNIDFGIALVRLLAAFFSGLVLLLGFFWAAWNREKQSWHDKIAGTVMVKTSAPRYVRTAN